MTHKLDILIPTLNEPYYNILLKRLKLILDPQIAKHNGNVQIHIHDAGRKMTTGQKRNELIENSDGEYFVQIDSDDTVPNYYIDELLKAIESGPDVISFIGEMFTNGKDRREFTIKLGSRYEERNRHYYRFCNHLCCYKRSTVEHVKFPLKWVREDYEWALAVQRYLKKEVHINKLMYTYDYRTKKS